MEYCVHTLFSSFTGTHKWNNSVAILRMSNNYWKLVSFWRLKCEKVFIFSNFPEKHNLITILPSLSIQIKNNFPNVNNVSLNNPYCFYFSLPFLQKWTYSAAIIAEMLKILKIFYFVFRERAGGDRFLLNNKLNA